MAIAAAAGLACLVIAVVTGMTARAEQTRPPTAAELSAAARAAVAARWRAWPTGRIFPAALGYTTSLLTQEKADRVGIAPGHGCGPALAGVVAALASQDGCLAALRATYTDPLQGVVYTTGVLAFPTQARADAFAHAAAGNALPAGLRAFALAGTGSALFTDAARQTATARQAGPYVVLTVAGYADGRPAGTIGERRTAVFAPAGQLAADLLGPLAARPVVRCGARGWSC
jgi:hypothetical protein